MTKHEDNEYQVLVNQIRSDLVAEYGPIIGGSNLRKVLGYSTSGAFRQAVYSKTVPIEIFTIEHRRGKFALTLDVASWAAKQKLIRTKND